MTNRRSSKPAASFVFPDPRTYVGEGGRPGSITDLPFVAKLGREWVVPACNDYAQAVVAGEAYGAHFAQFVASNQQNGAAVGALMHIAAAMDLAAPSPLHGYRVGFFEYLQKLVFAEACRRNLMFDIGQLRKRFGLAGEITRMHAQQAAEGAP